ncbi:MAG: NTP transferase domain-containing protein [Luteimonas sp.]|nr:NTP transferase domain-containing protein [Luteimonas sp.]
MKSVQAAPQITLGILAGGRATRLGGIDKAWLERDGIPQVVAVVQALASRVDAVIISANRNAERYLSHGLRAIHDRVEDVGPIAGLDTLLNACRSDWLLTLPVDATNFPTDLVERLIAAGPVGAYVLDDDGPQPLAALWPVEATRAMVATALAKKDLAIHALQSRLAMPGVRFEGVRFGNLNMPGDLEAAGIVLP